MIRSPSPFIFLEERGVAGYLSAMTLKALELRVQLSAEHLMINSHMIKFLLWFINSVKQIVPRSGKGEVRSDIIFWILDLATKEITYGRIS
ncbi:MULTISPECIES: hypothetical protein [unclassified Microcoleus]|uniref:hypothetical protein n=1 Tax=unclassified Microcoleus TaxID=2642155 RepID=UPI002FCFD033